MAMSVCGENGGMLLPLDVRRGASRAIASHLRGQLEGNNDCQLRLRRVVARLRDVVCAAEWTLIPARTWVCRRGGGQQRLRRWPVGRIWRGSWVANWRPLAASTICCKGLDRKPRTATRPKAVEWWMDGGARGASRCSSTASAEHQRRGCVRPGLWWCNAAAWPGATAKGHDWGQCRGGQAIRVQ
jgi:hypothetical protein